MDAALGPTGSTAGPSGSIQGRGAKNHARAFRPFSFLTPAVGARVAGLEEEVASRRLRTFLERKIRLPRDLELAAEEDILENVDKEEFGPNFLTPWKDIPADVDLLREMSSSEAIADRLMAVASAFEAGVEPEVRCRTVEYDLGVKLDDIFPPIVPMPVEPMEDDFERYSPFIHLPEKVLNFTTKLEKRVESICEEIFDVNKKLHRLDILEVDNFLQLPSLSDLEEERSPLKYRFDVPELSTDCIYQQLEIFDLHEDWMEVNAEFNEFEAKRQEKQAAIRQENIEVIQFLIKSLVDGAVDRCCEKEAKKVADQSKRSKIPYAYLATCKENRVPSFLTQLEHAKQQENHGAKYPKHVEAGKQSRISNSLTHPEHAKQQENHGMTYPKHLETCKENRIPSFLTQLEHAKQQKNPGMTYPKHHETCKENPSSLTHVEQAKLHESHVMTYPRHIEICKENSIPNSLAQPAYGEQHENHFMTYPRHLETCKESSILNSRMQRLEHALHQEDHDSMRQQKQRLCSIREELLYVPSRSNGLWRQQQTSPVAAGVRKAAARNPCHPSEVTRRCDQPQEDNVQKTPQSVKANISCITNKRVVLDDMFPLMLIKGLKK